MRYTIKSIKTPTDCHPRIFFGMLLAAALAMLLETMRDRVKIGLVSIGF